MNKTILITGGANGVGEALVIQLLKQGNQIIIIDIDQEKLKRQKQQYSSLDIYTCDLSEMNQVEATLDIILAKYKQIDVLINNAAKQYIEDLDTLDVKRFKEVMDLNLVTPVYMIQRCSSLMCEGSSIINISSVHGQFPRMNKYAYDASKAGLNLLTKEFSLALAPRKIKVNAVLLGATRTPMNHMFVDENELRATVKKIPFNRVAETEDIVKFVLFLVDENTYATGALFTIDGGRSNYAG